jgi:CBS domain-containing protein
MTLKLTPRTPPALCLRAATAADLMTSNPVSLRAEATAADAVALLTARGCSGAPVIGESGRPLGVLSQSDLLIHACGSGASPERTRVRDLMTPVVFSATLDTPAEEVVHQMLALKVHRLFVLDATGVLVGVISAVDVLRHLRP